MEKKSLYTLVSEKTKEIYKKKIKKKKKCLRI